jgi:hypothetical protein
LDRAALVKRAGAMLGCDFCGTYSHAVGVATLHIANSAFPASICKPCAFVVVGSLREIIGDAKH